MAQDDLKKHAAIADKREELAELCRRYDVARLDVFGSAARGTDFGPETSDADFIVQFDARKDPGTLERYFDFRDALDRALGRRVDLVESGVVRNPYLRAALTALARSSMHRYPRVLLADIEQAGADIERFAEGKDGETFFAMG